jgi:hypothetical protein
MDGRSWIRLLPWRQTSKAESKSAQITFVPRLAITRKTRWPALELQLVNRSRWMVWVEEASVVLTALETKLQPEALTGQARHQILQNVRPNDTLSVSLAQTIYDAAGRPQGRYSCLVLTNVRYRVFDEWCNAKLEPYRVEMQALTVVGLRSPGWHNKKIKQINGSLGLSTKEDKD